MMREGTHGTDMERTTSQAGIPADGRGAPLRVPADLSVIICTYNRADSLRQTLMSCCALAIPDGLTWELLAVDNNSMDHTRSVCDEFAGRLPIRYLFESRQGKSCALNLAIREARGELLLFTDDDVDLHPEWLTAMWRAAMQFPAASFLGGRCLPRWEQPPPRWLEEHSRGLLLCVSVCLDKGDETRFLSGGETPLFFGANFAIRAEVLGETFRFCESIGPRGKDATRQEESRLQCELLAAGYRGLYVGSAIVHHRNPADRMTERYLRAWYMGAGISEVRMGDVDGSPHVLFGVPRYLWRVFLIRFCRYVITRLARDAAIWLPEEIAMARTWGRISEFRRRSLQSHATSGSSC